ncbi:MAG: pirin family protein [Rhodospirillaceae bacterium]|nr:pirin family protein [Rhodospirillaceae bacterium]MBL6930883.1 pirin family protein [Rhodospirillales bacterium]MBL6941535.1 pirin family protein [Rhodospirillales bacterium]
MSQRTVTNVLKSQLTSDGAGVTLRRSIGSQMLEELDPFLLLDNFGTENPDDYIAGFPDHPHRGFETVTYMIKGLMRHRDNTGAEGLLKPGGVQWMTAGRGIIHSEMPEQSEGEMSGFQLWVNLPASKKMCEPRYQDIDPEDVPTVSREDGTEIRVIAGIVDGVEGPVNGIDIEPVYLDVSLPGGGTFQHEVPAVHTSFIYVFEGIVDVAGEPVGSDHLAILSEGEQISVSSSMGGRFILLAGRPFGEPIARYGPFVMNTKDEIRQAIDDFQNGRF